MTTEAIRELGMLEETYAPTDNVPVDNILNFEDYVKTHKE